MTDQPNSAKAAPFRALVICPGERPAVAALARRTPLVLTPFLGKTILDEVLAGLASRGATAVTVLASDRPEHIREAVGQGQAWGMRVEVAATPAELTSAEAMAAWGGAVSGGRPAAREVVVADHWPALPGLCLWESYTGWLDVLIAAMRPVAAARVGMRETAPGVFTGLRARIADSARLIAPCWIGANVFLGANVVAGPGTVIEDDAYVEEAAEIRCSVVGPRTYLGAMTELGESFAWGRHLLNLQAGSLVEITDRFLLHDLGGGARREESSVPVLGPVLERAWAIAPGFWRKLSGKGGG